LHDLTSRQRLRDFQHLLSATEVQRGISERQRAADDQ
jgi:hypothetical protein